MVRGALLAARRRSNERCDTRPDASFGGIRAGGALGAAGLHAHRLARHLGGAHPRSILGVHTRETPSRTAKRRSSTSEIGQVVGRTRPAAQHLSPCDETAPFAARGESKGSAPAMLASLFVRLS